MAKETSDQTLTLTLTLSKAARKIKKSQTTSLYNSLRSIYEDSAFVLEIAGIWPELPLVANLRCGLWYAPRFDATCYFKSTDGHQNNWGFSTTRLNLHVAVLAGQKGGCIIVDSTKKGKRFPDSLSKTIPIWCCVLNRAIKNHLQIKSDAQIENQSMEIDLDISLHLPLWIPETEKNAINSNLNKWTNDFESCGADINSLANFIKKPLRPLWISQNTLIWLNEVPSIESWNFTPIILISASNQGFFTNKTEYSEFNWNYIPGSGDDEESWANGLNPKLFWEDAYEIINAGPQMCNKLVREILERERVYLGLRGENLPQGHFGALKSVQSEKLGFCEMNNDEIMKIIFWIGISNIGVASIMDVSERLEDFDCMINCEKSSKMNFAVSSDSYLNLSIVSSKVDRFSLYRNLPSAVDFAKLNLMRGKRLLICCQNGEDISICVCLAIITSLFDESGNFDGGESFSSTNITKWEMRKKLIFICNFAIKARPSRGNLKQVFNFLTSNKNIEASVCMVK
ncbi:hypothetical protein LUZ60_012420 [Juncus effusus]|nr:hypothetical protein LUZ60_012420 [Juncus effusus]